MSSQILPGKNVVAAPDDAAAGDVLREMFCRVFEWVSGILMAYGGETELARKEKS